MASSTTSTTTQPRPGQPGLTKTYLFAYNTISVLSWGYCVLSAISLLPVPLKDLNTLFPETFPNLLTTQSIAILEILHSLLGIVRAPLLTTAMQVASRLLLVWGIMYPFSGEVLGGETTQYGDYAYLGCLGAWGITEMIRYGFFGISISGGEVPKLWAWLRYNTFYVLYPIGISSECALIYLSLGAARDISPLFYWGLVDVLAVYVPGSYILYTHMIAQRRKVMRGKQRVD